jgi:hypothetical protein
LTIVLIKIQLLANHSLPSPPPFSTPCHELKKEAFVETSLIDIIRLASIEELGEELL